jgi:hypoxanthine phosphoribosyltransferase
MKPNKKYVTWQMVAKFINALAHDHQLQNLILEEEITSIYAIPRGGLCLGVMLSHKLKLPLVMECQVGSLIVDDISDTGKTLEQFKPEHQVATMFWHKQTVTPPDFTLYEKKDAWIVFPWERE